MIALNNCYNLVYSDSFNFPIADCGRCVMSKVCVCFYTVEEKSFSPAGACRSDHCTDEECAIILTNEPLVYHVSRECLWLFCGMSSMTATQSSQSLRTEELELVNHQLEDWDRKKLKNLGWSLLCECLQNCKKKKKDKCINNLLKEKNKFLDGLLWLFVKTNEEMFFVFGCLFSFTISSPSLLILLLFLHLFV